MASRRIRIKDTREALLLLGQQDLHLREAERQFGVKLFVKHDPESSEVTLTVRGSPSRIERAVHHFRERQRNLGKGGAEASAQAAPELPIPKEAVYVTAYGRVISPQTENQKHYVQSICDHDLTIAIGPAGTGKTFLAVAHALRYLKEHKVSRIVLTRPVVETGEKLGFLPGDIYEKVHPYLKPLYDAFYSMLGPERFRIWREDEVVEIVPLAYMRGRTLENAFVILDEAQNTTPEQMKMFLTRMGFGSKIVITGDVTQIDLEDKRNSGLILCVDILKGVPGIAFVSFGEEDVLRNALIKKIIRAYELWEKKKT